MATTDSNVISNKVYESIQPYTPVTESTGTILYANQYADVPAVSMSSELKELIDSDVGLTGPNLLIQLEQKFRCFRNGPWYVDSRDGIIYIHNRKFHEEPVTTYTYYNEPGEVIRITINTEYVTKSTKVVLHEGIDPVTKEVGGQVTKIDPIDLDDYPIIVNDNTTVGWAPGSRSVHGVNTDVGSGFRMDSELRPGNYPVDEGNYQYNRDYKKLNDALDMKNYIDATAPTRDSAMSDYLNSLSASEYKTMINNVINAQGTPANVQKSLASIMENIGEISDPDTFDSLIRQATDGLVYRANGDSTKDFKYITMEKSKAGSNERIFGTGNKAGDIAVYRSTGFDIPLYKLYQGMMARYGGTKKYLWAANANANGGLKNKEKLIKMNMTVVGRPMLTSSMVINVQNIGKRWSGYWYVKKCTHKMSPNQGYLCDLELVQNHARAGQSTTRTSWSTQNVLHVYTSKDGTTTYSQKPEANQSNGYMEAFTQVDFEYLEGKYNLVDRTYLTNQQAQDLQYDIAKRMVYYEKNASDPTKSVYSTPLTYDEEVGDVTELSVTVKSNTDLGITEEEIINKMSELPDLATFKRQVLDAAAKGREAANQAAQTASQ